MVGQSAHPRGRVVVVFHQPARERREQQRCRCRMALGQVGKVRHFTITCRIPAVTINFVIKRLVIRWLNRWVDPLETVVNGSRTVHHVWSGVRHVPSGLTPDDWDVELLTLDAGLVSPSTPTLTPVRLRAYERI